MKIRAARRRPVAQVGGSDLGILWPLWTRRTTEGILNEDGVEDDGRHGLVVPERIPRSIEVDRVALVQDVLDRADRAPVAFWCRREIQLFPVDRHTPAAWHDREH